MADIRISLGFTAHPKTLKLRRRLGLEACWALLDLWTWAGENRTSGDLTGMTAEDVAIAACWHGDPDVFVATLLELRWLDKRGDAYALHAWAEHQSWLVGAERRSEVASERAKIRWEKREAASLGVTVDQLRVKRDAPRIAQSNAQCNAPEHPVSMLLSVSVSESDSLVGRTTFSPAVADATAQVPQWSAGLLEIQNALTSLHAPPEFNDPAYWKRIDDWLGANDSGVAYLAELRKFLAWHDALPVRRRKKNLKQAFRNWLAKAEQWSENRAQRQEFQRRR